MTDNQYDVQNYVAVIYAALGTHFDISKKNFYVSIYSRFMLPLTVGIFILLHLVMVLVKAFHDKHMCRNVRHLPLLSDKFFTEKAKR